MGPGAPEYIPRGGTERATKIAGWALEIRSPTASERRLFREPAHPFVDEAE